MTNSAPEVESQPAGLSEHKAFSKAARRATKTTPKPTHPPEEKTPPAGQEAPSPGGNGLKPYSLMQSDGLHKYAPHKEGWSDTWICGFFRVLYRARGIDGLGWRTVLEVQDRDGNARPVIVLDADIGGQDGAWHKGLSDAGLMIHPEHRRELARYLLLECDAAPRQRFTVTTGLVGDAYVTHGRTIGASPEPMVYMGADRAGTFSEAGSAESWREAIGRYAEGNSRMILALCASLAAPLLPLSGIGESGGFHLFGSSGDGKTTLARVAASAWGLPMQWVTTWRSTSNATEGTAAKFNHFLLILDEIREAYERDLQTTVMMLGNGSGKGRMRDNATLRERLTWLLLWLSTGEYATSHYLEAVGIKSDPGMAVRQVDIPSDAGKRMGVFEKLHGFKTAKALAEHLRAAGDAHHGAVGVAWLEYITREIVHLRASLPDEVAGMAAKLIDKHTGAESQVLRVTRRFALLAVAGELATQAGLTGWKPGAATWGIRRCLEAWLEHRGGPENLEERRILERLRDFIGRNWQGRFILWDRATDEKAPAKSETVGYRKEAGSVDLPDGSGAVPRMEYFITPEGWAEIFKGMDPHKAALVLMEKGALMPDTWSRNGMKEVRPYRREYLPGMGRRQCYRTVPGFLETLDGFPDEACGNA